ncbi:MAG: hypothetical protein KME06_01620 [Kastovskya adunca ATA6-11-RM4]|jgi:hypothetical protein|nr:hypothetical protein [Kastovskya adunca ATA6-11-RM4]
MDLDQQLQALIENAPSDGRTPEAIAAIAPVLKLFASQLQHLEYYILQTLDEGWVLTTLSNRAQPDVEKNVLYAFPTLKDAADFQVEPDPQIVALPLPVTHILFQMFAMDIVNSTVFFETPGNLASGTEVNREDLQNLIHSQLQQMRSVPKAQPNPIPPDIA